LQQIAELLAAEHRAEVTTTGQKAALSKLTQQTAAWLLSVSARHLRDHQPARNVDGTYSAPELVQWYLSRRIDDERRRIEKETDANRSAKERQAIARAIKLEEEAKALQDTYVLRADVMAEFQSMAAAIRAELESLPKTMANDFAPDKRDWLMGEMSRHIRQMLRRLAHKGSQLDRTQ